MNKISYFLIACFLFFGCKTERKPIDISKNTTSEVVSSIKIKRYDYDALKPLLNLKDDKTYVVNFWATWCAPCVKELPAFEKLNAEFKDENVEVLLVSLDFPKQIDEKLIPFLSKRNIQSNVVLLDDTNEQRWITDIDKDWSGALPGTLIYNKNARKFYEQSFDYKTLQTEVQTFLNP